jgi:hypothetical protein
MSAIAYLGRPGEDLLGERNDRRDCRIARRALARKLDLVIRHPEPRAARVCATRQ